MSSVHEGMFQRLPLKNLIVTAAVAFDFKQVARFGMIWIISLFLLSVLNASKDTWIANTYEIFAKYVKLL